MTPTALLTWLVSGLLLVPPLALANPESECIRFKRGVHATVGVLNRQLPRRSFSGLGVWDARAERWQPAPQVIAPRARVIVLNFWAHYCEPCAREMPALRAAIKDMSQGRSGQLQLLWVAEETNGQDMQGFLNRHPELLTETLHADLGGELRRDLQADRSLPVTMVLDRDLAVRFAVFGVIEDYREFKEQLDRLLSAKP